MWKSILYFLIPVLTLLGTSCANENQSENSQNTLISINIIESFQNQKELYLSNLAQECEYVFLETKPECMVGIITDIAVYKDLIIVLSPENIHLFDRSTGSFIREIGSFGDRGPDGYFFGTRHYPFNPQTETIYAHEMDIRQVKEFSLSTFV